MTAISGNNSASKASELLEEVGWVRGWVTGFPFGFGQTGSLPV